MQFLFIHPSTIAIVLQVVLAVAISIRVIMKRPATGVALAWLLLVVAIPFGGAVIYLMIGERRIGLIRSRRIEQLRGDYQKIAEAVSREGISDVDWSRHPPPAKGMNELGQNTVGFGTVRGSKFEMMSDTLKILKAIARDVDAAEKSVLMEFYIWSAGGLADEVLQAVIKAAQRGVSCRLLIDDLGANAWWRSKQPGQLREAGVHVQKALPVGLFRSFVGRTDLRVHRKIVVVDGKVAWTGSMNLVDPGFFKQDAGVGEWVDAMVRVTGAVVVPLAGVMIGDWMLETGEPLSELIESADLKLVAPEGNVDMQVIPSGPGQSDDALLQMILALINSAQDELILTTPYLVPDESLLRALRGAAGRGVKVSLVVPEKVDSFLTRYASRSYYDDMMEMGVKIFLFRGGLLHTKSISVDKTMSMFGTVNLDMRSLWINYEVALFVYDTEFGRDLRALQQSYIDDSDQVDFEQWKIRSFKERFLENSLSLVSPLL